MNKKRKRQGSDEANFEKEKRKRQGSDKENIEKEKENNKVRTTGFNGSKRATLRAINTNNGFQMWPSGLPLALFWQAPTEAQEGPMLVLPLVCSFCAAWAPFSALLASFWTLQMLPFVPLRPLLGTYWHYFGRPQRKHKKDPCLCFRWWAHFVPLGLYFRLYICPPLPLGNGAHLISHPPPIGKRNAFDPPPTPTGKCNAFDFPSTSHWETECI